MLEKEDTQTLLCKKKETRENISPWVFLCMDGLLFLTTLSVTEAELVAGTECAQDMLYTKKLLESMDMYGTIDVSGNDAHLERTLRSEARAPSCKHTIIV